MSFPEIEEISSPNNLSLNRYVQGFGDQKNNSENKDQKN